MKRVLRTVLIAAIAVAALVGGFRAWHWYNDTPALPTVTADFSLPDLNNQPHWLSDWQGKVVVLNFWATWCEPCREEMPSLVRLNKQFQDRGIQVVGIAIDTGEAVARFAKEAHIDYPLLIADETGPDLMARYGNTRGALPFTVILGRDGTVLSKKLGSYAENDLKQTLEALTSGDSAALQSK